VEVLPISLALMNQLLQCNVLLVLLPLLHNQSPTSPLLLEELLLLDNRILLLGINNKLLQFHKDNKVAITTPLLLGINLPLFLTLVAEELQVESPVLSSVKLFFQFEKKQDLVHSADLVPNWFIPFLTQV
jgi:hypothetical protein